MRTLLVIIFFYASCACCLADISPVEGYIEIYAPISQKLMSEYGVPASIKLAQAILESNSGRSALATQANNHFGIKCGSQWRGPKMMREDDDYDEKGKLKKSCFRSYSKADESFRAHSEFLKDPRKAYRYGFLFELDPLDYKAWAHGLKKAGYATNPQYAHRLISLIERYELYKYDTQDAQVVAEVVTENPEDKPTDTQYQQSETYIGSKSLKLNMVNGIPCVKYQEALDLNKLAESYGISYDQLIELNDLSKKGAKDGQNIFIERKKPSYEGKQKKHKANGRETIADISQIYGVDADILGRKNKFRRYSVPKKGAKIKLCYLLLEEEKREGEWEEEDGYLFEIEPEFVEEKKNTELNERDYHIVQEGETLFSISRFYGVNLSELRSINKLDSEAVLTGQKLKLK